METLYKVTAHAATSWSLENSFKFIILNFSGYEQKYILNTSLR
jgi:hypothetical protein